VKNPVILGALFVGAFIAAVLYLKPDPANPPASTAATASHEQASAEPAKPAKVSPRSRTSNAMPSSPRPAGSSQVPPDPRLVALEVSPEDGLTEFVRGPDDRVIAEIDKDPNSLGFQKPRREYTYANGRVVGLTAYRYYPAYVEISRTAVSYKPDGSIEKYEESTSQVRATVKPKDGR
jgi:hypothetical protein